MVLAEVLTYVPLCVKPVGAVPFHPSQLVMTNVFGVEISLCPHPVAAKVIKAAQIARAWNLKRDFATETLSFLAVIE